MLINILMFCAASTVGKWEVSDAASGETVTYALGGILGLVYFIT